MTLQFSKEILKLMNLQQLSDLAATWNIKNVSKSKIVLENQIYSHSRNHLKKRKSKNQLICEETNVAYCIVEHCKQHRQPAMQIDSARSKTKPTKFVRPPLPICWFVASCQLLSAIDWPPAFYKILEKTKQHDFTRISIPILMAKLDVSGNTFKAAPAAHAFIDKFKMRLTHGERDWNIENQQDASEFIVSYLDNIDAKSKKTPKAFFGKKPTIMQKRLIKFINNKLCTTEVNMLKCNNCNHEHPGGGSNSVNQTNCIMLKLPPHRKKDRTSVQDILSWHQREEHMEKNTKCGFCDVAGNVVKETKSKNVADYLFLSLSRNEWIRRRRKNGIRRKTNERIILNQTINFKTVEGAVKYNLIASLDHLGTSYDSGHWICKKFINKKLWHCDDATHEVTVNFDGKTACLLLYEKILHDDVLNSSEPPRLRKRKINQSNLPKLKETANKRQKFTQHVTVKSSKIEKIADVVKKTPMTRKRKVAESDLLPLQPSPKRRQKLVVLKSNVITQKRSKGQHLKSNKASKQLQCSYCKRKYKTEKGKNRHIAIKHEIAETYCVKCKKYFKDPHGLYVHIGKTHSTKCTKKCQHCGKAFRGPHELQNHLKALQDSKRTFSCFACSEEYQNYLALKTHVGMKHATKMKPFDHRFDFTSAIAFPSWKEIKEYRHKNPDYNAAGFLKMIGDNVKDVRIRPNEVCTNIGKKEMLDQWKQDMKHDVSIQTCAVCGRQVLMVNGEFAWLAITSSLLLCCKADKNDLPPKNSIKYKSLHLVERENGDIFKLCPKGVIADKVLACTVCHSTLKYATKTKKPPIHTIAHYDLGKKPTKDFDLKKLTFGEKLAISKVIVYVPEIQFKPVHGKKNIGIKGHAFGIRTTQEEIEDSIVKILPRQDLQEVIRINLCGEKEMHHIAKQIIKQGHLDIRIQAIMPWLRWFKAVDNPHFRDVKILPQSEAEEMLKRSVDMILEKAFDTTSGTINKLMDQTRAELCDEEDHLNQHMDEACVIRNALITREPQTEEPMHAILKQIQQKLTSTSSLPQKNSKIHKVLHADLLNEYTENHNLLSAAFPHIFPFGLTKDVMGISTVPKSLRETWMLFYDHRSAEELHLIFLLFDQQKRHANNAAVAFKIKAGGDREQKFVDAVNHEQFLKRLETAIIDPKSESFKHIKSDICPLIKIVGRTLPWSVFERSDTLGKLYSLTHFFGMATHFITLSPSMRHNMIALKICVSNATKEITIPLHNPVTRSQLIIGNPVAATYTFYRLLKKFFEIIVKLPTQTFTGRNMEYDELIKQETENVYGAFGHVTAHFGVMEEQTGGNLHYHGIIFGPWNLRLFQKWCHEGAAAKQFQQLIDSHVTCKIPDNLKPAYTRQIQQILVNHLIKFDFSEITANEIARKINNFNKNAVTLNQPYPDASAVDYEGARLAALFNHHQHSLTCWKNNRKSCRLAMPQPQAQETFFTEICANDEGEPVLKHPFSKQTISNPPQRGQTAFSIKDERVIVSRLARQDVFEEMQVECNLITTALLRCNTSIQPLLTEKQAKAAIFYISNYMSKHPFELQNLIPLLLQAEEEYRKWGSTASDAGAIDRKAKNIFQKLLNKTGYLEVSDQQATAAVMGYDSFISSHAFAFVEPWKAVLMHRKLYDENPPDVNSQFETEHKETDAEMLTTLEINVQTKKGISVSTLDRYLSRGDKLRKYSMYMYTLMIGHRKPLKNKSKRKNKGGRPDNPVFPYDSQSKASKCFEQIMKSHPTIPRISGKAPPAYPGDEPDSNDGQKFRRWEIKAKEFVEFYSLLFLPFDHALIPVTPFQSILPWSPETSWQHFWRTFNAFENAENFYCRTVWFIFHNMVDNLRQRKSEKTLVTKWRFLNADMTENVDMIKGNHATAQEMSDDEDDLEALRIITTRIRDKYGSDKFLSATQKDRRKAAAFLTKQIQTYRQLQRFDLKQIKIAKKFTKYTPETCKLIIKNMLQAESTIDPHEVKHSEHIDGIIDFDDGDEIKLHSYQLKAIEQLKQIIKDEKDSDDLCADQFLGFMQGIPGAGKTTTAKKLAQKLGLRVIFSGTTSTAAAQLKAETINKVLGLGLNRTNFTETRISGEKKQKIIAAFDDVQLLIIDEASMLTPVTLAKINFYLQQALGDDYLFGGVSILLIGDMYQFPPVEPYLRNPSLYQAAVMLALGLPANAFPNNAYKVGAQIFTRFRLVILDGQARSSKQFTEWLNQLRNPKVEYPVTDEWLSKINILSIKDFENKKANWTDIPIVVSGNAERYKFIKEKIEKFAFKHRQPVLCWNCPVRVANGQYKAPSFDPEDVYDQLIKYFVRGAKCVLTESLENKLGLGKGSEGIMLDAVWKAEADAVDINALPVGKITRVSQPDYLVIKFDDDQSDGRFICLQPKTASFEDIYGKTRKMLAHECELSASVTFHKMQGKTVPAVILSLNSTSNISRKIYPISLPSLYVGCSRVHDFQHLRALPLSSKDREYLKNLKWNPYLRLFFQNFDDTGRWKTNGLWKHRIKFLNSIKSQLGMCDLSQLTKRELKKFAKDLDVIVSSHKRNPDLVEYVDRLRTHHAEGIELLHANNKQLLQKQRMKLFKELQNQDIGNMKLQELRYYAKRLGIKKTMTQSKAKLQQMMQKLMLQQGILFDEDEDVDMITKAKSNNTRDETSAMDVVDTDEEVTEEDVLMNDSGVENITEILTAKNREDSASEFHIADRYELQQLQRANEAENRLHEQLFKMNIAALDEEETDWEKSEDSWDGGEEDAFQ